MDLNNVDNLMDHWSVKGLLIGLSMGFILEVFMIRSSRGKPRVILSVVSIICVGLFGWITFDIAGSVMPESPWKPEFYALISSANTWVAAKVALDGRALSIIELFLPESMKRLLRRRNDDK